VSCIWEGDKILYRHDLFPISRYIFWKCKPLVFCNRKKDKQYITVDNSTALLYTVYNRRKHMKIIINNSSMVPIYEQIMEQIKAQIISGELKENDILPSVRTMAKELKISALTAKKAYDNLEAEGMTVTVHGKGTYVAASNTQLMEEERRKEVETDLEAAIQKGRRCGMKEEEIRSLFELIMEDEYLC
jgi:GntR family transcriptional regulator